MQHVLVWFFSIITALTTFSFGKHISSENKKQLSHITVPKETITVSQAASPSPTQVPTQSITNDPTPITQTNQPYLYPNATNRQTNGTTTTFQSTDDPDTIANWYAALMHSLHMNALSTTKTNTNNNINNQLAGSNSNQKLAVTITKSSDQSFTSVTIISN